MWNEKPTALVRKEPGYLLYGYELHRWEGSETAPCVYSWAPPGLAGEGKQQQAGDSRRVCTLLSLHLTHKTSNPALALKTQLSGHQPLALHLHVPLWVTSTELLGGSRDSFSVPKQTKVHNHWFRYTGSQEWKLWLNPSLLCYSDII